MTAAVRAKEAMVRPPTGIGAGMVAAVVEGGEEVEVVWMEWMGLWVDEKWSGVEWKGSGRDILG